MVYNSRLACARFDKSIISIHSLHVVCDRFVVFIHMFDSMKYKIFFKLFDLLKFCDHTTDPQ